MKKINHIIILLGLITLTSFTYYNEKIFHLGNANCKITVIGQSDNLARFISLHDNENTSVEAYISIKSSLPNTKLFELKQTGQRLLKYNINGKNYFFDPNRFFSTIDIKKTIIKYNQTYPKELEEGIKSLSDSLLKFIKPKSISTYIVAIHNNTENNFSVLSYKNSKDAIEVFISKFEDIDNFFIVTNKIDFDYFKLLKRNVVLQSNNADDDGSLSIFAQKNGIPYINIETQQGQLKQQIKMIQETYLLIKNKNK